MSIRIIAVGKKHEPWVQAGIARFEERLRKPYAVEWIVLPHSSKTELPARQDESASILGALSASDFVILLDERGDMLDSLTLANLFEHTFASRPTVTIIIGGAYGVSDDLRARADRVLSLSSLVFPHQLVRLIIIEQLYRAQEIRRGGPYHHV